MNAANKVALNTLILYTRMLFTVGISFYSTRLTLSALGNTDFGIFTLIAGLIAMLAFLNNAMATSTQRFLSYYQGKKDLAMQKKVFSTSLLLHISIGIAIVITLQIGHWFFFNGFLNIPQERILAAKAVYQMMSLSIFFSIVTVPFTGTLVARENMVWVAVVSIMEVFLKLVIAIIITELSGDRLVTYSVLMGLTTVISFSLYSIYCLKKYEECSVQKIFRLNLKLTKELTSFTGWNMFGALCSLGRTQGIAIILNIFIGTAINAAYGIANQVTSQLSFFSSTLLRALNPQIMKSEGVGDRKRMLRLSMTASKFGFFLLAIIAIPCIFEIKSLLSFWLKTVPPYAPEFCVLTLIHILVNQLTIGFQSALQAIGKIKDYQLLVGGSVLLSVPLAYLSLYLGYSPIFTLWVVIGTELIACTLRIFLLNRIAGPIVEEFFRNVLFKEIIPVAVSILICILINGNLGSNYRFILTIILSSIGFVISIYFTGLCKHEKKIIAELYMKLNISQRLSNKNLITK